MADEEKEKKKEDSREAGSQKQDEPEQKGSDKKTSTKGYLKWIVLAVVVVICAGAGFGLGRLFGRSSTGGVEETSQQTKPDQTQPIKVVASQEGSKGTWYYDFEPVVANLNEPGATRYIRAALTLQISTALDSQTGTTFLEEKKPILRNWLTIYLAGQTIEETRGDRNLRRIQSEILDAFNEKLFPDSKPLIKSVFFKDFAIQ